MTRGKMKKVILGMSGGVDSSVAGLLLREEGYQVIGVMLRTAKFADTEDRLQTIEKEIEETAQQVAQMLDIPFFVVDARDLFKREVISYFVDTYSSGLTPNPCMVCNQTVKWKILQQQAEILAADYVATGHYAKITKEKGEYLLLKGKDGRKDQSYFLAYLEQAQLRQTLFPLGGYTKDEVRAIAGEHGLSSANRPESQDICFLDGVDYRTFIHDYAKAPVQSGKIINRSGEVLGEHSGLINYTIGQRKGLGVYSPQPLYVLEKNFHDQSLVVGHQDELGSSSFSITNVNWISGDPPTENALVQVKIRYQSPLIPGRLESVDEEVFVVNLEDKLRDITPGQFAVMYQGNIVLGGGMISLVH